MNDDAPVMTAGEIAAMPPEDLIDWRDNEVEAMSLSPLSPQGDPTEPFSAAPATSAALDAIASGAPESRTRPNKRWPAGGREPTTTVTALVDQPAKARRQVTAAVKADDKAAATSKASKIRPERQGKNPSVTPPIILGKKVNANDTASETNAMSTAEFKPAKTRPETFDDHMKLCKQRCAVMIDENEIMGDPFSPTLGWGMKVEIDPGTSSQPSIGLDFKFNKKGVNSKSRDDYNTFAVGWEPGIMIGGKWMMDDFAAELATRPSNPAMLHYTFPPAIRALCKKPQDATQLWCISFFSNVHRSSEMEVDWAKNLKGKASKATHANLRRMYKGRSSYCVTVWFMNPFETAWCLESCCMTPFMEAVDDHLPPYYEHLDENDEPMIDFNLPSIHEIGDGMYRRYPKVTNSEGQKALKMWDNPTYLKLPKTITWDFIKTFHVTYDVNAEVDKDWHCLFIQKLPELKVDSKDVVPDPKMKYTFQVGVRLTPDPVTSLKDVIPPLGSIILFEPYNGSRQGITHKTPPENVFFGHVSDYGGQAWLERTKTDFCVLTTTPKNTLQSLWIYSRALNKDHSKLSLAKLHVKVNIEAVLREKGRAEDDDLDAIPPTDAVMNIAPPKKCLEAEPNDVTIKDAAALRLEYQKVKAENESLRTLMRDQDEKIRMLAEDLRKVRKERDEIIQVAEKKKHQRELKPKEIQKALNAIPKILK